MHRADQRRAEGKNAIAVARRAFGEQHHGVAAGQPLGDLLRGRAGAMAALTIDEDRPLQLRKPAEDRPAGHFLLGDEHRGRQRGDDEDVQPRGVIGENKQRLVLRALADLADADADQRAEDAMIDVRHAPLQRQPEDDADQLKRQQQQRENREGEEDEKAADHQCGGGRGHPAGTLLARSGPKRKTAKGMILGPKPVPKAQTKVTKNKAPKKARSRSDAATDGDRLGVCEDLDGDRSAHALVSCRVLQANDGASYPQVTCPT